MKKRILPILLLFCFVLISCGPKKPSDVSEGMYNVGTQALETVDNLLDGKITIDSAIEQLDSFLETSMAIENKSYDNDSGIVTCIRLLELMMSDIEDGFGSEYDYEDLRKTRNSLASYLGVDKIASSAIGDSDATDSQRLALESAQSYLKYIPSSYDGLIYHLENYEKFSHKDAVYAADNCGADWNEQAIKSAKEYLRISTYSYDELVERLEFEKFTKEQAIYGADNCGVDWD